MGDGASVGGTLRSLYPARGENLDPESQSPKHSLETADVTIRPMLPGEERAVCDLIQRTFDHSVAPHYSEKGRRSFRQLVDPGKMTARVRSDHFVLLAVEEDVLAGMIEMRRTGHVTWLFVRPEFQGRGLGRELLEKAVSETLTSSGNIREVTVNSSPNALGAYEKMGFTATGREQSIGGVRCVPMKKVL